MKYAAFDRHPFRRFATLLVATTAAFTEAHVHAQIPTVWAAPEDLVPKHEPAYFIERLQGADEPIWREAQVGLAMSGARGLDPLAELFDKNDADPQLLKRVRGLIAVGMLTTIRWDDLKRRPQLAALVLNEVLERMDIAKELVAAAEIEVGKESSEPPHRRFGVRLYDKAPGFETTRMERFKRLSGCAVPAIQYLCNHEYAICRGQGLLLAEHLDATVCRPEIEKLKSDQAEVPRLTGPMMVPGERGSTLAKRAAESEAQFKIMRCLSDSIEKHGVALFNHERTEATNWFRGIRSAAEGYARRDIPDDLRGEDRYKKQLSITWDEWWNGARVVWKEYRETHGPTAGWAEKQRWNNWLGRRTTRREVDITGSGVAATKLRVAEPVGGHCKITEDGEVIAEGLIPLETDRRAKREYPRGGFKIEATLDGCRPWWVSLASHNGQSVVVRFYKEFLD